MFETHATSAYSYPLLIKHLWHTPLRCNPDQEIVSANGMRYDYATLYSRIGRLASGLEALGVKAGDTVAVMDWDNHRSLECFFALPMMAAILHTINVRLSPEQILYTINHAEDDVILVHADFIAVIDQIKDRFERPIKLVYLSEEAEFELPENCILDYESMLEPRAVNSSLMSSTKIRRQPLFIPPAPPVNPRVYFTAIANWSCIRWH